MTDLEHELRAAMHEAVDAEQGLAREMIQLVRRRHRRHNVVAAIVVLAVALAAPVAAIAAHGELTRSSPPTAHKTKPKPKSQPTDLSGAPMRVGTNMRLLDVSGAWFWSGGATTEQSVQLIAGLPAPAARPDAFARVEGGWVAWSPVSPECRTPDCAGPPKEFYFVADGSLKATPVGSGYAVAEASQRGELWVVTYKRPADDTATASAIAQLVSTAGLRLGSRYQLPPGYLLTRGVGPYLLLRRHDGASVLWDSRAGRMIRQFADVIGAGPEQIAWTQGCASCRVQILNVITGYSVTSRILTDQIAAPQPVLTDDGALLAVRVASGVGVLETGNGTLTVIPGTALSSAAWFKFGWLSGSHRLIIIAGPNPAGLDPSVSTVPLQLGYWQPGDNRLTVAAPGQIQSLIDVLP
jgi:hypothetical protein